ncbi:hypothetical protein [Soonwooa sp.]|uniref:hypothetical protein n=1 Tax=Soonwooa sp. TaxID=1938592 RepID=UPI00261043A0|nr:hypothetical protein [Soonwooa sp.]
MIKKILTTFFVMLMFALGHSQNISLIGNKTITVAGASQPADLNWTIPAGKNRIVIVQYWIERDHRNGSGANATTTSNNFPSADLGRTAFSPTINGTAMVPKITGSYAAYFAPSTSSGGTEANNTYLSDNYHMYFLGEADLPTSSSATFKFGIPNAPKNAADNLIISISVYSNVSNLSIVNSLPNPSGIDFIRDSSGSNPTTTNGSGNKSTAVTAATTVVPGRTASEVLYHGIIASSMEKNVALATGSTWTAFNQTPLSNSAGYPFNTDRKD